MSEEGMEDVAELLAPRACTECGARRRPPGVLATELDAACTEARFALRERDGLTVRSSICRIEQVAREMRGRCEYCAALGVTRG